MSQNRFHHYLTKSAGALALGALLLTGGLLTAGSSQRAQAAPPLQIDASVTVPGYFTYQGMLRDQEGRPMSGIHKMLFRIYDDVTAPASAALWLEEHAEVTVRDGHFSVLLGATTPIPPQLFHSADRFIGVTVGELDEMTPRQRFASVPYAIYANHASALSAPNGAVDAAVYVDPTGKVGMGTTQPVAPLHISTSQSVSATVMQVNAGGQSLAVGVNGIESSMDLHLNAAMDGDVTLANGGGQVGVGTANPQMDFHVSGNRMRLQNGNRIIDLRADGSAVDLEAQTTDLYISSSGGNRRVLLNAYGGAVAVNTTNPAPNTALDVNGNVHIGGNGSLRFGADLPPVIIHRFTSLPADNKVDIPNVSPDNYFCTVGAWSIRMDIDEDEAGPYSLWTSIEGSGATRRWVLLSRFYTDSAEQVKADVICYLNRIADYRGGLPTEPGFN
jgi:hypothetical protein